MAGNISLDKNDYICYIGENKSEDIFKLLNEDFKNITFTPYENYLNIFEISHKKFQFKILSIHRLLSTSTKFIDENGKVYKGTLYFLTDLITILDKLHFKNPYYFSDINKKMVPLSVSAYPIIFIKQIKEIKNIINEMPFIDIKLLDYFRAEKKKFANIKQKYYLLDLNPNIALFQDINLVDQEFKIFDYRAYIISYINDFLLEAKKRTK